MASQPAPQSPDTDDNFWSLWLDDNEILIRLTTDGSVSGTEIGDLVAQLERIAKLYGLFDEDGFFEIVALEQGSIILRLKAWHNRTTEWRKAAVEYATIGGFLVAVAVAVGTLGSNDAKAEDPVHCPAPVNKIEVRSNQSGFTSPGPEVPRNVGRKYLFPENPLEYEETVFSRVVVDELSGQYVVVADDGRIIHAKLGPNVDNTMVYREASITIEARENDDLPTITQILGFA